MMVNRPNRVFLENSDEIAALLCSLGDDAGELNLVQNVETRPNIEKKGSKINAQTFYGAHEPPTLAEAAVVAALVVHGAAAEERGRWLEVLGREEKNFIEQQKDWRPPRNDDWKPPNGDVYRIVEAIPRDQSALRSCLQAMAELGAPDVESPTADSVKGYFRKLFSRQLFHPEVGKKVARNPWVYMEAARLIRTQRDTFANPDADIAGDCGDSGSTSRWILKTDLSSLRAAARRDKRDLQDAQIRERVTLGRAEKAEQRAALALSELEVVKSRAQELEEQLAQRKQRATSEVFDLRRKVDKLTIDVRLADRRAAFAAEEAAIARSQLDQAAQHAAQSSEQHALAMEALSLNELRLEAETLRAANEQMKMRAARSYTASLSEQLQRQEEELVELRARRANNMAATKQLNLEKQRCKVLSQQLHELRRTLSDHWGKDTLELAEQGAAAPRLHAEIKCLALAIKEAEASSDQLLKIVYPPKPMEGGAYDMKLRFTIMKLIGCANVCHSNVPSVLEITRDYWGITMPGRWRKVLDSVINGVRSYKKVMENLDSVREHLREHSV